MPSVLLAVLRRIGSGLCRSQFTLHIYADACSPSMSIYTAEESSRYCFTKTEAIPGLGHAKHSFMSSVPELVHVMWCRAVSRSEAGQQKHLLVLDSHWRQTEEILLDLGPRFHAMAGAAPALPPGLRPGDRFAALCMPKQ